MSDREDRGWRVLVGAATKGQGLRRYGREVIGHCVGFEKSDEGRIGASGCGTADLRYQCEAMDRG